MYGPFLVPEMWVVASLAQLPPSLKGRDKKEREGLSHSLGLEPLEVILAMFWLFVGRRGGHCRVGPLESLNRPSHERGVGSSRFPFGRELMP